jgi:SAM-dependent methyltransferase
MGLKQDIKKIVVGNALLNKLYTAYLRSKRKRTIKKNYNSRTLLKEREKEFESMPIGDIFRTTYLENRWGGANGQFYSGPGSYGDITVAYVEFLASYIEANQIRTVVDIGCGDFNIGRQLTNRCPQISYTGVDVFEEIIDHHNRSFANDRIRFLCVDTTKNPVPSADLLLIREVLQHLSNASIQKIIDIQFPLFKHKIITEHHPGKYFIEYNIDKPDGYNTRIDHGSGIYLDQPPFKLKWKEVLSCEIEYGVVKSFEIID